MLAMKSQAAAQPTRRLQPSYRPWTPEAYQLRGSAFLQGQGAAALWLDPGMRKTSIVLHAFDSLRSRGAARKMLVIAPKKVCQLVWRQEAAKWEEFRHLQFVFLHGDKKAKLLQQEADVYLINPEGVVWLAKQYANRPQDWPFDTVTIDELTKFKNSQAERHKALRGKTVQGRKLPNLLQRAERRWGMTGTPNPNGYMDLFGQFLLLDDGAALGRFVTHFRDQYFSVAFNGFDYDLQPGAEKRIQTRLAPYVFCLDATDYVRLPELQDNLIEVDLEPEARAAYEAMRKTMIADLPGGMVEAANTAGAYNKLSQMAGGAVYNPDGTWQEIHTAKLDALSDLIDEMGDRQLLIGYEFNHEKDRLKARFGNRMVFLADARSDKQAEQVQSDWNAGRIQFLACHPASAGHGLNFQEGGAAHLCWFGPIWDLELWDQFIRRLRRSGNEAERVVRHILSLRNSIDELKLQALAEKDTSQGRLKRALTTVLSGIETPGVGVAAHQGDETMVMKLQRAGAAAPVAASERKAPAGWGAKAAAQPAETPQDAAPAAEERRAPAGWGKPPGAAPSAAQEQREQIQEKLNPETVQEAAEEAPQFSGEVIHLKQQIESGAEPPFEGGAVAADTAPARTSRSRSAAKDAATTSVDGDAIMRTIREGFEGLADPLRLTIHEAVARYGAPNQSAQHEPTDEDVTRDLGYQLVSIIGAAAQAAQAVATLSAVNPDAGAATYELLFGAIEQHLVAIGYADDSAAA